MPDVPLSLSLPKSGGHFSALSRRGFGITLLGAAFALVPPRAAFAYAHFQIGAFQLTAISDGSIDLDPSFFQQFRKDDLENLVREMGGERPPLKTSVNAYLLRAGGRNILIDCGSGTALGAQLGKVSEALAGLGVAPPDIDVLVLTHLHPDHSGGAVNADGSMVFPNAELFVSEIEAQYWQDAANEARSAEAVRFFFKTGRDVIAAYKGRISEFRSHAEILPGLEAIALPGHTPGHSGIMIRSSGSELLVWGDIVNSPPVQFAHPDWTLMPYDVDGGQAAATRRKIFDRAVSDELVVAGMHLPFPGIGRVTKKTAGFRFEPVVLTP